MYLQLVLVCSLMFFFLNQKLVTYLRKTVFWTFINLYLTLLYLQVIGFVQQLVDLLPDYELACEHEHSNCLLVANKSKVSELHLTFFWQKPICGCSTSYYFNSMLTNCLTLTWIVQTFFWSNIKQNNFQMQWLIFKFISVHCMEQTALMFPLQNAKHLHGICGYTDMLWKS